MATVTANYRNSHALEEVARVSPYGWLAYASNGAWLPYQWLEIVDYWFRKAMDKSDPVKRIALSAPPQHGKSYYSCVGVPSYTMGKFPEEKGILVTHSGDLAEDFGSQCRSLIEEHGKQVFNIELDPTTRAKKKWSLKGHRGTMQCVGGTSGISGKSADWAIYDDPFPNYKHAQSATFRQDVWNFYLNDLRTRMSKDAWMVLLQCLTAETPILMADGSEKRIIDVRPNDAVASYHKGELVSARVSKQRLSGRDSILKMTTTSGRIIRGNERHPFLVYTPEGLRWERLKNLSSGKRIVIVKDSGENGKVRHVNGRTVRNPLDVADTATNIITSGSGVLDTGHLHTIRSIGLIPNSNIDMELHGNSMNVCSKSNVGGVQSAVVSMERIHQSIGTDVFASTIVMKLEQYVDYCATVATHLWETLTQSNYSKLPLNTSNFTSEMIASIEPDGCEDVYDLEVEGTHNFVANGFVTHNTRWNDDDLIGRIKKNMSGEADEWVFINLPAVAKEDETFPDGRPFRKIGDPLCPELKPLKFLEEQENILDPALYASLYQCEDQRPEGVTWGSEHFPEDIWVDEWPKDIKWSVMHLDPALGKDAKGDDYQAVVYIGVRGGKHQETMPRDVFYVDADIFHETVDGMLDRAIGFMTTMPRLPLFFSVESTAFQQYLVTPLSQRIVMNGQDKDVYIYGLEVSSQMQKIMRIIHVLTPYVTKHKLKFIRSKGSSILVQQLRNLGSAGTKKDGPDALAGAMTSMGNLARTVLRRAG